MPKNAEHIQTFLKEVRDQCPDVLTQDLIPIWEKLRGTQPQFYGLQALWRREQIVQAVPRTLKAAVILLPIALETKADRVLLINRLLASTQEVSDTSLITWLRGTSAVEKRSLLTQIETLFLHSNCAGYRAIAAEAFRIGWPKFYKEDLGIDLNVLCTASAPKEFWWGVRSTGTDLFRPNTLESVEWALAREKHGNGEQLHYHYTGTTLYPVSLQTLIVQLVRSLDSKDYEQRWHDAVVTQSTVGQVARTFQELAAYPQAIQAASRAEVAYRRIVHLKQCYT